MKEAFLVKQENEDNLALQDQQESEENLVHQVLWGRLVHLVLRVREVIEVK